jgi:hypothetical protein
MSRPPVLTRDAAETLALQALGHIAADPATLDRLLALTGLAPDELRLRAADPAVLAGVLDYLLGSETDLLAFCSALGIDPTLPARARRLLPGYMGP